MADATYDAVIVGGGAKGLVVAMYLAKYGGMKVGVFEKILEIGGGLAGGESAPGCQNNTHAAIMWPYHFDLIVRDFPEAEDYGVKFLPANPPWASTFEDGSCLCLYNDNVDADAAEKTGKELARFSERDANVWLKHHELWTNMWLPALMESMSNPPGVPGEPSPFELLFFNPDSGIDLQLAYMNPWQAVNTLYDSPELKMMILRLLGGWGLLDYDAGMGAYAAMIPHMVNFGSIQGGTHNIAHAYQRLCLHSGVKIYTDQEVKGLIIENGRAVGVRLANGSEIGATKAVITNVSPLQLTHDFLGSEHCPDDILRRVKNLRDWATCISWFQWTFHEPPKYNSGDFNPDINGSVAMVTLGGDKDIMRWRKECSERRVGIMPKEPCLYAYHNSSHDPTFPYREGHVGGFLTEATVLPAYAMKEKEWMKWHKEHAEFVIKEWGKHASNVTWDNVVGYIPVSPWVIANTCDNYKPAGNWAILDKPMCQSSSLRPVPQFARYHVPWINGLYCTGGGWWPGVGATAHEGYNCYKIMADQLGLRKPWEEGNHPY